MLKLVAEGCRSRDIAARLHISPRTASNHLGRIYGKLGVSSRASATLYAIKHHFI